MSRPGVGPIPARIMLVGEAYGESEEHAGEPFVGPSGQELNRMLHEAGIMRSECYVTNLVNARPPNNDLTAWIPIRKRDITPAHVPLLDKRVLPIVKAGYDSLLVEIAAVQPAVIVAFGNSAMWALTQKWAITKWRGSILSHDPYTYKRYEMPGSINTPEIDAALKRSMERLNPIIVIPTYHPAAILRQWDWRNITVQDLRRAAKILHGELPVKPEWNFRLRPSFHQVNEILAELMRRVQQSDNEVWLDFDLETKLGHIDCAGISWSKVDALCIPFMSKTDPAGYWMADEEANIVYWIMKLLTHPNVRVRGQNLLYDCQYTYRHWHFVPRVTQDTMISQHTCFSGMRKSLDFQASLYCDYYIQWKPDKTAWKEGG